MAEQSINIPQVLVFLVVSFLAVRWYFSKPATAAAARIHTAHARISPAQIDQVASMFPQLSRRDIAWDLSRNGGNVAATTERALTGRGLDTVSTSELEERLRMVTNVLYRHPHRSHYRRLHQPQHHDEQHPLLQSLHSRI
jgi:hypothetical protein